MPNASSSTFAVVARQFVVHDALEMMRCFPGSYAFSFTPSTTVTSGSFAGAVMITFFAPAWMCFDAVAVSTNSPVDSTAMSTPSSFHGSEPGSRWAQTRTSRPFTKIASPFDVTSAARLPCTESCLSRCASVFASARSLTATISRSSAPSIVRKKTRPIRPNPLTPTRILMEGLLVRGCEAFADQYTPGVAPLRHARSRHAGHGDDADVLCAGGTERARTLRHRRAGRVHVVHDDHDRAAHDR